MAAVLMMVGQKLEHPDVVQQLLDIEQNPCKPQYRYANEVSQRLFSTASEFANVVRLLVDLVMLAYKRSCDVSSCMLSTFEDCTSNAGTSSVLKMCLQEHQDASV